MMKRVKIVVILVLVCGGSTVAMDCMRQACESLCSRDKSEPYLNRSVPIVIQVHPPAPQTIPAAETKAPLDPQRDLMEIAGNDLQGREESMDELVRIEGYLQEKKVTIDARDSKEGKTALHRAVEHRRHMLVGLLIKYKAKTTLRDNSGKLPKNFADDAFMKAILEVGQRDRLSEMISYSSISY